MYLILALTSAVLLGFYDLAKKKAVTNNAVLPVLLLSTCFMALIFSPFIISAELGLGWFSGTLLETESLGWEAHRLVLSKAVLVLSSWILGYMSIKHLPITIVGTLTATRPVMVLMGALLVFGDRLNLWQWSGVILSIISLILLSQVSKKEGLKFTNNKWIILAFGAAVLGAASGLYDKYLMDTLEPTFVMGWTNIYQSVMMVGIVAFLWYPKHEKTTPFRWSWAIPAISILLSAGDFTYLSALAQDDAMVSMVSIVRRSSVVVTFLCGAFIFHEKNIKDKGFDLLLIIIGMILIFIGSN